VTIIANDLRKGSIVLVNDELCEVVDIEFVRPGNWRAMAQAKLKNLKTGSTFMQRYATTEKVEDVQLETKLMQFLYASGDQLHFMDLNTYEQIALSSEVLGDQTKFLKEQMEIYVKFHEKTPISVDMPTSVDLLVEEAPPNVRGNSATSSTKPVTCEGGHVVNVPMFIEAGEYIKVDTRTGVYLERTKK